MEHKPGVTLTACLRPMGVAERSLRGSERVTAPLAVEAAIIFEGFAVASWQRAVLALEDGARLWVG